MLGAADAQAELPHVRTISVVTRLIDDLVLGKEYARPRERLSVKLTIDRVATNTRGYLEKSALAADLPHFTNAFLRHLASMTTRPDVIHAHFADAAMVAQAAQARFAIPFVYTPHALGIDKRNQLICDAALDARISMERLAIASAGAMIVSSPDEADRQVAAYGVRDRNVAKLCLPPGVPARRVDSGRGTDFAALPLGLADPSRPIILAIARPVQKKNLSGLMRPYAASSELQERANLVILAGQHGSGLLPEDELRIVAELKEGQAKLVGKVALPDTHDATDVEALYRKAAHGGVFVNVALHEPFGLTLIEAAEMGVPVVATCHGGPCDIIDALGHGLLVDPREDAQIAAACLRILSEPDLHRGFAQSARDNIWKYSWPRYAEQSVSLYRSLIAKPGPALAQADRRTA